MRALIKVTLHPNGNGEGRPDRRQQQNKSVKRYIVTYEYYQSIWPSSTPPCNCDRGRSESVSPFIANFIPAPVTTFHDDDTRREKEGRGNPARPLVHGAHLKVESLSARWQKKSPEGVYHIVTFGSPLRQKDRIRQAVNHLLFSPSPALSLGHPSRLCSLPPQLTVAIGLGRVREEMEHVPLLFFLGGGGDQ